MARKKKSRRLSRKMLMEEDSDSDQEEQQQNEDTGQTETPNGSVEGQQPDHENGMDVPRTPEASPPPAKSASSSTKKRARPSTQNGAADPPSHHSARSVKQEADKESKELDLLDSLAQEGMEATSDDGCVGAIHEIKLQNFMCHKHLHLKFGRRTNFLVGLNGSGKSSICSAIQLVFGSRANVTGRNSNLADVVREGSDGNTLIYVSFYNEGKIAFRPHIFGNRIGIQRRLLRQPSGTVQSQLRLYNSAGKEVKDDTESAKHIIEQFVRDNSISVDNPANVITQEKMKEFVNANPQKLYSFFMQACRLSNIYENVHNARQHIQEAKERLASDESHEKIEQLEAQYVQAQQDMKQIERIENMDEHVSEAEGNVLWAEYNEQLETIEKIQEKVNSTEEDLERKERIVEKRQRLLDDLSTEYENKEMEFNTAKEKLDNLQDHSNLINAKKRASQRKLNEAKRSLKLREKDCDLKEKKVRNLEQEIADMESNDARDQLRRLKEKEGETKKEFFELRHKRRSIREKVNVVEQELNSKDDEKEGVQSEMHGCEQRLKQLEEHLRSLQETNVRRNTLKMYDAHHRELHALIEQHKHKFHVRPIGPCGIYLKLRPEAKEYHLAAETGIGRLLSTFLVDNKDDGRELQKLCSKLTSRRSPDYIVLKKPSRLDESVLRSQSPSSAFKHFLSLLDIDDSWVHSALCEVNNLHRYIVCKDLDEAKDVCGSHGMPQNVKKIYFAEGTKFTRYGRSEHIEPNAAKHPQYLSVSPDEKKQQLEEEMAVEKASLREAKEKLEEKKEELQQYREKRKQLLKEMENVTGDLENRRDEINSIREKISAIESELTSESEELENKQEELDNARESLELVKKEHEEAKEEVDKHEKEVNDSVARMKKLAEDAPDQGRLQRLQKQLQEIEGRLEDTGARLKKGKRLRTRFKKKNDEAHNELAEAKKKASQLKKDAREKTHADVPPDERLDVPTAKRELERVQKERSRIERDFENSEINATVRLEFATHLR
eukprot:gb/GECG01008953.1/.p1 GENE.gb/GECG01008953.1/~~gb/GECG01008953.1/.p1  ORF type:complete len:1007 (+),score=217.79 gb/GECG01008953.1/:1-3021(+)